MIVQNQQVDQTQPTESRMKPQYCYCVNSCKLISNRWIERILTTRESSTRSPDIAVAKNARLKAIQREPEPLEDSTQLTITASTFNTTTKTYATPVTTRPYSNSTRKLRKLELRERRKKVHENEEARSTKNET